MARPHKLAKTMELQNFDDDDDNIFCNLPDHIVHRIHSFLPLKDLSRLCCVSRRFRDLCISNSFLVLSNIHCNDNLLNRFKNFVDRFMVRRSLYGVKTHQLFLRWSFEGSLEDETYRVNTWLYQAVNSCLELLKIELTIGGYAFALPPCVLSCNSLKSLIVKTNNGILKFPSASLAGTVTTLNGETPKLFDTWRPNYSGGTSLKVNAPNLVSFEWGGHVVDFCCIEDFSSPMLLASIALGLSDHHQYESSSIKCNLDKLLHSMRRAKSLKLWDKFVEVLFKHGCLQSSFNNLEFLTIVRTSFIGDEVPAISSLLRETTNLKYLELVNPWDMNVSEKLSFKMEYWESQNLMFTNQLKIVHMDFSNGGNDVELMKYLLKNTKELGLMGIVGSLPIPKNLIIDFNKYKKPRTKLGFRDKSSIFGGQEYEHPPLFHIKRLDCVRYMRC
ncbi:f-box/lrr-repeat protein 13 [Fagus crenata]